MVISGIKPSLVNTYECISALGPAGKLISGKSDFQLYLEKFTTHLLASSMVASHSAGMMGMVKER